MYKVALIILFLLIFQPQAFNQKRQYYPIAFYNVENLFDPYHDKDKEDLEFTSNGRYRWTEDKYDKKLTNIAFVISKLGTDLNSSGITIIGLAEIENKNVLKKLLSNKALKDRKYSFVHQESPDIRGIDVALVYNTDQFKVSKVTTYPYTIPGRKDIKTRDILVVSGILAGEPLTVLVNHWPSRRDNKSSALRQRAAAICKQITDSVYKANKHTNIIIMGDMNDDPSDISTRVVLNAKRKKSQVSEGGLYNTMWCLHTEDQGSLKYRGKWNLFDQIIISRSLLGNKSNKLVFLKSEIYSPTYLLQQKGKYKGAPFRTFDNDNFVNGYSDHLPTLIYLTK